jgi:hypothetical protein
MANQGYISLLVHPEATFLSKRHSKTQIHTKQTISHSCKLKRNKAPLNKAKNKL